VAGESRYEINKEMRKQDSMPLIFIECGTTMSSPFNTGIQKVVRSIVRESEAVGLAMGLLCVPVIFENNNFSEIGTANVPNTSWINEFKRKIVSFAIRIDRALSQLHFCEKKYQSLRYVVSPFIRRIYISHCKPPTWPELIDHSEKKQNNSLPYSTTPPILLLLDSTWNGQMWDAVEKFRASGGHVCAVLYDLIPFLHPETVEAHTLTAHTTWWLEAPLHVDSILCISQSVREEFLVWQQRNKLSRTLAPEKVGYFYLGAELNQTDPFIQVLSLRTPSYLVVGSLEPRKNHAFILDAFEQLWGEGDDINLVIVGGHGWKSEKLLDRIKSHPEFGVRLFLINNASDRDLAALYDKSDALIIASLAEGFGLPIVEAFQRGTKVICSDIPVFREVAGDHAVYFDLESSVSLANKVSESAELSRKNSILQLNEQKKWITWKESTEQLFAGLLAFTVGTVDTDDSVYKHQSSTSSD